MVRFLMMIDSRSLNFEDKISLRGAECNIPPVSIGTLPVIVPEELNSWKITVMEIFYDMSA
jgi:hypothetical protein